MDFNLGKKIGDFSLYIWLFWQRHLKKQNRILLENSRGISSNFLILITVHKDVMRVLEYYESIGVIKLIPWELPKQLPNDPETRSAFLRTQTWQRRRLEILPYNHCLYQNIYSFRDEHLLTGKTTILSTIHTKLRLFPKFLQKYDFGILRNENCILLWTPRLCHFFTFHGKKVNY